VVSATSREHELVACYLNRLPLVATGRSNAEIADELFISAFIVKSQTGRIFVKLDLRDRAAAIIYAYYNGVVTPR